METKDILNVFEGMRDVTIKFDTGEEIKASKFLLRIHSIFFNSYFSEHNDDTLTLSSNNVNPESFLII